MALNKKNVPDSPFIFIFAKLILSTELKIVAKS